MSIPRPLKLGIFIVLPLALGTAGWFAYKNYQKAPAEPAPIVQAVPITQSVPEEASAASEETSEETDPSSCGPLNTWAKLEGVDYQVPEELKFRTSINAGESVAFTLPFTLANDLNFHLKAVSAGDGSEDTVAHCKVDGQTLRCTEVFHSPLETYCGPLTLADGSQKFVQLFLDVKRSGVPLPADLDSFAVSKEARPLGLVTTALHDEKRTAEEKIYRSLPLLVWESADPNARLIGKVPGGFFEGFLYVDTNAVYIEKVGDRYLTNLLANTKQAGQKSKVYHWVSQVSAKSYEDYLREDIVTCNNIWSPLCKAPSLEACQDPEAAYRDEYQIDKGQPILRNESEWVVFKPTNPKLPTLYMPLEIFPENTSFDCD